MISESMHHVTQHQYRPDIDGLRAVAVLAVIAYHATTRFAPGGFVGVDVFFVISGYLISGIIIRALEQRRFSFAEFYSRRIVRIFPSMCVVLLAVSGLGWFTLLPSEYSQLGKHVLAGAGFVSNIVLWQESGYFDAAAEMKPLLHLWSLGIEEQFYLAWPLVLFVSWKRRYNLAATMAVIATVSFSLNVIGMTVDRAASFYMPWARLWELLAGGILWYLANAAASRGPGAANLNLNVVVRSRIWDGNVRATLGAGLLLAVVFAIDKDTPFPGWWALAPVTAACLLLSAGPDAWINRRLLSHRWLVFIGLISYPLYLWHWPLLSFTRIMQQGNPGRWSRVAAVGRSFLLAWLTYRSSKSPCADARRLEPIAASCRALWLLLWPSLPRPERLSWR